MNIIGELFGGGLVCGLVICLRSIWWLGSGVLGWVIIEVVVKIWCFVELVCCLGVRVLWRS